jgi:hypothetical protein
MYRRCSVSKRVSSILPLTIYLTYLTENRYDLDYRTLEALINQDLPSTVTGFFRAPRPGAKQMVSR